MVKIEFKNIHKIFGKNPQQSMEYLNNGMSKEDLLEKYGHTVGIHNLNLSIQEGEFFVIMGLSGSGKSTLVRHLNGLIEATSGQVMVDGQDVTHLTHEELLVFRRYKVSMVFQKFGLFPHKTVMENVSYGLKVRGEAKKQRLEKSQTWIETVGLSGYENVYPNALSGGMQQRVGIARALCTETDILIMDEPFSALDPMIRTEMQDVVLGLKEKLKKTIIFVTHDLSEAVKLADRMAILNNGELIQVGTPQEIRETPNCDYVKRFVESAHLGPMP